VEMESDEDDDDGEDDFDFIIDEDKSEPNSPLKGSRSERANRQNDYTKATPLSNGDVEMEERQ